MTKRALRAVGPDETARRRVPMSVLEAAEGGTREDELRAMRVVIAKALDDPNTSARDLAALSRRQIEISREIEVLSARSDEESRREPVGDAPFDAAAI